MHALKGLPAVLLSLLPFQTGYTQVVAPEIKPKREAEINWTGDWIFRATPEGVEVAEPTCKLWRDPKRKLVILDGEVCLRKGVLEMFACPRGTKEHESIVVVDACPETVHKALVAVGAQPGTPARFRPYKQATGSRIKVVVVWMSEDGKREAIDAREWIRNTKTGEQLEQGWVFAGSRFVTNGTSKEKIYLANGGDFICVANFPTASMDIPVESTNRNEGLLCEAFTKRIPKRGTKVRLVLMPEGKSKTTSAASAASRE